MITSFRHFFLILFTCALVIGCGSKKVVSEDDLSSSSGTPAHLQKRVLVMMPQNKTGSGGEALAKDALELIEKWMGRHSEFIYVSQKEVDPDKTFLTEEGAYDLPAIFDAGNEAGVAALLLTEIEEIELKESGEETGFFRNRETATTARVRLRVYDLRTQKEILGKRKTATYSEENVQLMGSGGEPVFDAKHGKAAVKKAIVDILELLPKYAKRIDWAGQIARIDGQRIYIDAGRVTGLQRGQILQVFGPEAEVPNKASGKPLGFTPGRLKGTVRIYELMGEDAAIALAYSGMGFNESDRVELYLPRDKN